MYCGLALHHAKLYDKIHRSEQKHKVALEVLSYHNSSSTSELEEILAEGPPPEEDRDEIARYFPLTSEQGGIKYWGGLVGKKIIDLPGAQFNDISSGKHFFLLLRAT